MLVLDECHKAKNVGKPKPAAAGGQNDKPAGTRTARAVCTAVDETVILLYPPLPLVGVSIAMERGCH